MCKFFKFYGVMLLAASLLMGCNKKTDNPIETGSLTEIDLEKVMNSPYSKLNPDEHKVKLEQESIDFLNELQAVSELQAIDVLDYLIELLDYDVPEINEPYTEKETKKSIQTIMDLTLTYGVFTWNTNKKEWTASQSNSELKFVFPASNKSKSNNASLSLKATNSSDNITWIYEDSWDDERYEDIIKLPKSASGILSVDNKEIAKILVGAEYEKMDKIEIDGESIEGSYPVKNQLSISAEDYLYWYSVSGKGKESKVEMQLSKGKKQLIETLFAVDISFKEIINEVSDDIENLFDLEKANANGYMKLMNNIALIYKIDAAKLAKEIDRIDSQYSDKQYYDEMAKALSNKKLMVVTLVSLEDNFKIADIIYKVEQDCGWWGCDYYFSPYLKFGDGTEVEMEAYFSSGFNKLETKWEDFVDAFNR